MSEGPRVTVCIPTFRRPRMLERAVRSVLGQTYAQLRVAVYDNASGDETAAVMERLCRADARVEYHAHEKNIGAGANFDFAMAHVWTRFFSLLSDDDLLLPGFLEEAMSALDAHPEAAFFCSRIIIYSEIVPGIRRRQHSWPAGVYAPGAEVTCRMLRDNFANTGVVFREEVRESVGSFSRFPTDRDYMAVAASKHSFVVSEREHAVFIVHAGSFTAADPSKLEEPERLVSVRFARDSLFSSIPPLLAGDCFSSDDKTAIFQTAMQLARGDTLYLLLIKALPAGRFSEIDEALVLARWMGFGLSMRVFLRLLRAAGRVPILRRWMARALGVVATMATKRLYEPFDAPRNRELVAFVEAMTRAAPAES